MKRLKRSDGVLIILAFCAGLLFALSTQAWYEGIARGQKDVIQAKVDLMKDRALYRRHNEIYSKVGDLAWRDTVKPEFMSRLTWKTVMDTGSLLPSAQDIVSWVRLHPKDALQLLDEAGQQEGR